MTATRAKATTSSPKPPAPNRWRRIALAATIAAVVAAAALLARLVTSGDDDTTGGVPVDQFMHVHGLAAPSWSAGAVFLSTHQGLIRIDGDNWTYVSEVPHDFMGFAAHPSEVDVLFSSGHPAPGSPLRNPIGFMMSTDGGVTWEVQALEGEVDFHAMAVGADGDAFYGWNVTGEVGFYRGTDGGQTWEMPPPSHLDAAGGALTLAAHPTDDGVVFAGTPSGLLTSSDAGTSWAAGYAAPVTAVAFDPIDPSRVLAYSPAPGEGLLVSSDDGQNWAPGGWQLASDDDAVGYLAIDPQDPEVIFAGTYREDVYRSSDGGATWVLLAEGGVPVD